MVSKDNVVRGLAAYAFVKHLTLISIILAIGIAKKHHLDGVYNKALCDICYLESQHRVGDQLFEFGACADTFNTGSTNISYVRSDALMWPQDGFLDMKPVSGIGSFIYIPAILWVIVVVIGSCGLLALCFKRPSELAGTLLALSFWMCVMCLTGVQLVFSLYPDPKGCYVSTAGQGLKTASTVIVTLSACMIYGTTARLPVKVRGIFATLQFVFFFTYALLVLVSGVAYTKGCDDDAGLALSLICLFSLIECPLVVLLVLALWRTILAVTRFFWDLSSN